MSDEAVVLFSKTEAKGDAEKNELESQHLAFDDEQFEAEMLERDLSRTESREKRKAAHKLEL